MSATGTAMAKKSGVKTKSAADAQAAAEKMGAVIIPIGNGGYTLVQKAEAERRRLIDMAKATQAAEEANAEPKAGVPDDQKTPVRHTGDKKRAASGRKAIREMAQAATAAEPVVTEPETTEQVIAREVAEGKLTPVGPAPKKPYNPEKLSGAAEAGKAPKKGQLPAGLLAYLAKKHSGSAVIAAAAGAPYKATKKARAKKARAKK